MHINGNTILITGGGSGIGRGLAHEFHKAGNTVIVAGRRRAVLDETAALHPGMIAMSLDLMDASGIAAFARQITTDHPALNVVINNAGMMAYEESFDLAVAEAMVATNLLGTMRLTSALLPHLRARRPATIVNVTSSLAFIPHAISPTYSATKAALHSWSMTMREQLRPAGVEVIELIPPAVQTELLPGLDTSAYAMPLDAFIAETMAQFRQQPTPPEIFGVEAGKYQAFIDRKTFHQLFRAMNPEQAG